MKKSAKSIEITGPLLDLAVAEYQAACSDPIHGALVPRGKYGFGHWIRRLLAETLAEKAEDRGQG